MKKGDYFKGRIENYAVTGRISEEEDSDHLVAVFDNEYVDDYAHPKDKFGFADCTDIDNFEEIEIITKREFDRLKVSPLYTNFLNYQVRVVKGINSEKDLFKFGCGDVSLKRYQIKGFLKALKSIPKEEFTNFMDILDEIISQGVSITIENNSSVDTFELYGLKYVW